jgi:two-component system OmpR family sensor kinase/two-component system sensor histidine kinase BaeS
MTVIAMTSRLWFKLTAVFALVITVGILVTVVLTRQGTATQFTHFMIDNQMLRPEQIQQSLVNYYHRQTSWQGVDEQLDLLVASESIGRMSGMMGGIMGMMSGRLQILDDTGQVVADSFTAPGALPLNSQSTRQWPLVVDGQQVGTLLVEGSMMGMSGVDDQTILTGVTRAVLIAGLVAGAVALLMGGLLVHQITQPLAGLTQASGRIAAGDLSVRVPFRSHDELGDLAVTFNRMADSLETQKTLRKNFMADIAHELRTPLAGIQGTVEALQDGIFPLTVENLLPIHDEVTLLNRLVEDLRTLANAEAGNIALDLALLSLEDLAERQVNTFQYRAAEHHIDLRLEIQESLPSISGDGQRLSQVLSNLIDNALRHTPDGGTVCVCVQPAYNGIQLIVRDTGTGIPSTDLPHIFDRFYRVDRSRSRETGGSGLGLAIARQLVEAQGGRIWANSPPPGQPHGAEFHVVLPEKA